MVDTLITNKILSEKNVVSILVCLYVLGPKTRTELYHMISTNPRMPDKLNLLMDYGLVKPYDMVPGRRTIALTELGTKYATVLCSLEKMLGGSVEKYKWSLLKSVLDDYTVKA
jgi:DNA-binding HxlR family transcriptional regulator